MSRTIPNYLESQPVDKLPDEWMRVTFGSIVTFSQYGLNSSLNNGELFPMLRMNNIQTGRLDTTDLVHIRLSDSELTKFALRKDDLLVNRTNSYDLVGKTALFDLDELFVFASYLVRFRLNTEKAVPRYISYWFNSQKGQQNLKKIATKGVSQANINPTTLQQQFIIPLPPLPEQRKIAEILSTWDEAINLTEQLIAAKQRRKQALMQRLLTGQVRFPGFEDEWKSFKAGDLFEYVSIKNNDDEQLLSVTQDKGVLPRDMLETRVVNPEGSTKGYKLVIPGNFIISLRSFQGGLEYSVYRGLVSPAYTVLQAKQGIVDDFYRYYFKSYEFIGRLAVAVIGIRDGKQISYEDFCTLKLPYPTLQEQAAIADILCAVDQELALHQQKLTALRRQKQGLMQQLLTGRVRVG